MHNYLYFEYIQENLNNITLNNIKKYEVITTELHEYFTSGKPEYVNEWGVLDGTG